MLTPLDDFPFHQISTTFDTAGPSDPRFFDRYWWVFYDPEGRFSLCTGLGVYKNMNVMDGFAAAVLGDTQHNMRLSRLLRPNLEIKVGPLRYEILEGLKRIRLVLDDTGNGMAFDLVFQAEFDAFEESTSFERVDGILVKDYMRYVQHGRASGWVSVAGQRFESDSLWCFRDRSFGVRPGQGGGVTKSELSTAKSLNEMRAAAMGFSNMPALLFACGFGTDELAGATFFGEADDGSRLRVHGNCIRKGESTPRTVVDVIDHDLEFYEDGNLKQGAVTLVLADGEKLQIEFEPLTSPHVYVGFGYHDGYNDRMGLGAARGDDVLEADSYCVGDPANLVDNSGGRDLSGLQQLDMPNRVVVNGRSGHAEILGGLTVGTRHARYRPWSGR
jgi:hypothetical protein